MTDPLAPIPSPPLDLSAYEAPHDVEAALLALAVTTAQQASPLRADKCKALAKKLGCPAGTFNAMVKEERKRLDAEAAEARALQAEEEGRKATAIGGSATLFFDGDSYYRMENDSRYGKLQRADALMHLKCHGFRHASDEGDATPAERALLDVQQANRVTYAGPFCGRNAGLHEDNGMRILCTNSPTFTEGVAGGHPRITSVLAGLFGEGRDCLFPTQRAVFVRWLQYARKAMRTPDAHLPGHVLTIVGPSDCGKTLLQKYIITAALGGRSCKPTNWLSGATPFNSDLWGAEHLQIDDFSKVTNDRARDVLREKLKEMVASTEYPLHPKGREARTFRPIWRISLTANDDPESISQVPGLNGNYLDKVILLRAYTPPVPLWDSSNPNGRAMFESDLKRELASFLHEVDSSECPPKLCCNRFGVVPWHHPEMVNAVDSADPLQYVEEVVNAFVRAQSTDKSKWVKGKIRASVTEVWNHFEANEQGLQRSGISRNIVELGKSLKGLASHPRWKTRMRAGRTNTGQYYEFDPVEIADKNHNQ